MIVADPTLTIKHANQIATIIARRLDVDYFDVLQRLTQALHALPVHRSPGAGDQGARGGRRDRRRTATRGSTPGATRCAPTRRRRRRQPRRLHERRGAGRRGRGADVRQDCWRARTVARRTRWAAGTGSRSATTARFPPRSGHDLKLTIDRDVQWYTQRVVRVSRPRRHGVVRRGRGDGHPHRRAAGAGRLPDLRRQRPLDVAQGRPRRRARCATSTSPARWRRCSPPRRCSTPAR